MPLELQIIRASEFVRLGARDHLDFKASKEALQQLAQACRKRGVDRALLDLREIPIPPKPLFTPQELAALVETFREAGFARHQRLAVLYRSDPHHGARTFAFISTLRGWQVRAFEGFEEALLWLSEEKGAAHEHGELEIPVQLAKRKVEVKRANGGQTGARAG
jgi:hypothetical protein